MAYHPDFGIIGEISGNSFGSKLDRPETAGRKGQKNEPAIIGNSVSLFCAFRFTLSRGIISRVNRDGFHDDSVSGILVIRIDFEF